MDASSFLCPLTNVCPLLYLFIVVQDLITVKQYCNYCFYIYDRFRWHTYLKCAKGVQTDPKEVYETKGGCRVLTRVQLTVQIYQGHTHWRPHTLTWHVIVQVSTKGGPRDSVIYPRSGDDGTWPYSYNLFLVYLLTFNDILFLNTSGTISVYNVMCC